MGQSEFTEYAESIKGYIGQISKILTIGFDTEVEVMKQHLALILGHRASLVGILAELERYKAQATGEFLPHKSKDLTDKDRSVILTDKTSEHCYWCDFVDGLVDTIDKQASALQTLLSFEKKALTQLSTS